MGTGFHQGLHHGPDYSPSRSIQIITDSSSHLDIPGTPHSPAALRLLHRLHEATSRVGLLRKDPEEASRDPVADPESRSAAGFSNLHQSSM